MKFVRHVLRVLSLTVSNLALTATAILWADSYRTRPPPSPDLVRFMIDDRLSFSQMRMPAGNQTGLLWDYPAKGVRDKPCRAIYRIQTQSGALRLRQERGILSRASVPDIHRAVWGFRYEQRKVGPIVQRSEHTTNFATLVREWAIPLWSLALVFAIYPTLFALGARRKRKRISTGHCPSCNYNLTGNTSGICPECGTPCPSKKP